ncbi:hypothetical protein CCACVL1_03687 [Corchorus capsularis]|uniref:Uncharacterized protein n=1 Tax=Corchorus capsularis TaxID=210143 RepID=A0A1R3JXW1_COCAP|nr:hypothetical protein CCACVL1_03687 [Corchorus capsularis]
MVDGIFSGEATHDGLGGGNDIRLGGSSDSLGEKRRRRD